ncbi:MAG: hypothetical protein ACPGVX_12285, partial [Thalassobaculaceae bacterium]
LHALESLLTQEASAELKAFRQWELETARVKHKPLSVADPGQYAETFRHSFLFGAGTGRRRASP